MLSDLGYSEKRCGVKLGGAEVAAHGKLIGPPLIVGLESLNQAPIRVFGSLTMWLQEKRCPLLDCVCFRVFHIVQKSISEYEGRSREIIRS